MPSSRFHPFLAMIALGCLLLLLAVTIAPADAMVTARQISLWLYTTVVALSAIALLLGVLNVVLLHVRRIRVGESEWSFSLVLLLCLTGTLVAGVVAPNGVFSPIVSWLFDSLIAPGEAALFALLPFFLAVAAWRYLRIDREGAGWMVAGVLLMIFVQMPSGMNGLALGELTWLNWLFGRPVNAVMQGVLLGGALTLVAAGVRLMIGRR